MKRSALISNDGKYRYTLSREWGPGDHVLFVMLNPSTADAEVDDPTIRKCIAFAKSWEYGGLRVINLFAYRATNPRQLYGKYKWDVIGQQNNDYIEAEIRACTMVVCAWGNHGALYDRDIDFMVIAGRQNAWLRCLGVTKAGHPKHPLFLPGNTQHVDFRTARP
jgi:hypothetical protein